MKDYGPENNTGYRYKLVVNENCSNFGWTKPLKNKCAQSIPDAFLEIIKSSHRKPHLLTTDDGTEYFNKIFNEFINSNTIKRFSR